MPVNRFDKSARRVFDSNTKTFGYPAVWTPADNSEEKTARVLYKDPTDTSKILQFEYNPNNYALEYKEGDFIGLKESVDSGVDEMMTITFNDDPLTQVSYLVREVHTIIDGKNFLALLAKI